MRRAGLVRDIWSIALTSALLFAPASHASLDSTYRIGIVRSGRTADESDLEAYRRFERRLTRWLENDSRLRVRARPLGGLEDQSATTDRRSAEIERAVEAAFQSSAVKPEVLEAFARELQADTRRGPLLQRLRTAQAWVEWSAGSRERARRYLLDALQSHPEGQLADTVLPRLLREGPVGEGFRTLLAETRSEIFHGCAVDLNIQPAAATVIIDGFPLGGRRRFELVRGKSYRAVVTADGFSGNEVQVDCRRAGQWIESVRLERSSHGIDGSTLERLHGLSRREGLESILFAHPKGLERLGLFLYTPGVGTQELPTVEPLSFASLAREVGEDTVPVASDVLAEMIHEHRATPIRVSLNQGSESGYGLSTSLQNGAPPTTGPAWYEKRAFWMMVGIAGVAILTGSIVSGAGRSTHSSPTVPVSVF